MQASVILANALEGLFWFTVPVALIATNDTMAYFCGFWLGRTRLIALSPKKTWEGFIGGGIFTMLLAWFGTAWFAQSELLTCAKRELSLGADVQCSLNPVFEVTTSPEWWPLGSFEYRPVQVHTVVLALFASVIAPFGGFFASGFKRAMRVKDFGSSLPGHGGVTDRVDCQFLMASFVFVYYNTFLRVATSATAASVLRLIATLSADERDELQRSFCGDAM